MKILMFAVVLLTCCVARAEWVVVSLGGVEDHLELLMVNDKVVQRGGVSALWMMSSIPSGAEPKSLSAGMSYRSSKRLFECDCKSGKIRNAQSMYYKNEDGAGEPIWSSSSPSPWVYPAPDTMGESYYEFACNKSYREKLLDLWRPSNPTKK